MCHFVGLVKKREVTTIVCLFLRNAPTNKHIDIQGIQLSTQEGHSYAFTTSFTVCKSQNNLLYFKNNCCSRRIDKLPRKSLFVKTPLLKIIPGGWRLVVGTSHSYTFSAICCIWPEWRKRKPFQPE